MSRIDRPLLVYDGDCDFCSGQVRYWQRLTGAAVDYAPYQQVAADHPQIPREAFVRSIQLLLPDGTRHSGAAAVFRVLAAGGRPGWLRTCRLVPGCAGLAEILYRFTARHRTAAGRLSRLLWGRERYPEEYGAVSWLFLRLLGLVYLAAFVSFGVQALGLIGSQGILPLADYLQDTSAQQGTQAWWLFPSVFWLDDSDMAIRLACGAGVAGALLLTLNILTRAMLPLLFLLYLSLVYAGQVFMNFQWDFLLLETGFLAIFLPWGSSIVIWLLHWVLFRLRFLSGAYKLLSGDESWSGFTALRHYFETQPLPQAGAWYAHQLPDAVLRAGVGFTFFAELVVPFLVFLPRRPRLFAAWVTILMQVLIMLTSNHNFFNLLTILLCLLLFDDRALRGLRLPRLQLRPGRLATLSAGILATLIVTSTLSMMWSTFTRGPLPAFNEPVTRLLVQWHVVNNYHVFPNLTTKRPELVIEGSDDGRTWLAYGFRYKPGDLAARPRCNIPHQPRLDWMMWFAAIGRPNTRTTYWLPDFVTRLLEGSPAVLGLLARNPFPDHPPRLVRARLEDYRFTTPAERAATGNWWSSKPLGIYLPPLSLDMLRPAPGYGDPH
ncbi:MAG: lipase maturation factor family protein [Pseudomonadota bacterium]